MGSLLLEVPAVLFAAAVALVFAGAGLVLWRRLLHALGAGPAPAAGARAALLRRGILVLAAAGVGCLAWGRFVEPGWPEVTHVRVAIAAEAPAGAEVRIVQISDLHSDPAPLLETRLPGLIAAESPDLIVFTGDSVNSIEAVPVVRECLTALARIAPLYAVRGNWDHWPGAAERLFEGTGARDLAGEAVEVDVRGARLCLAGLPFGEQARLPRVLKACPEGAARVLLYHTPDLIEEAVAGGVDLYLAGHTHGGQVALPFYGALVTFSKFGKKYESGLFREGATWLYVNRGIGMGGGPVPRVRFCAGPEITVLDLSGSQLGGAPVRLRREPDLAETHLICR